MNKGDMLRTLVNILGGFAGGTLGAVAGTATLPVAGSFAGATAGSVAGSAVADTLYSAISGGQINNRIPNNVATAGDQALPDDRDPFKIYQNGG
jgi:outer membrane lipoprotein SlyB